MAEKISVQIALEGGQEVARQLADIGEAGQKAFADIAKSAEQAGGFKQLDTGAVTAKLKELGIEGTAAFGKIQQAVQTAVKFETLVQGVQSVENAFVALGRAAGPIGLAIAAAFQAATKATIAFSETLSKISDQAVKAGMSFDQFRKLQKDLQQFGLFGDTAAKSIEAFQKALGAPISFTGLGAAGTLVKNIGEGADRTAERMAKLRAELARMPDTRARLDLAKTAFGPGEEQAAIAFVQSIRRAQGEMSDAEAKAYDLQQALGRLRAALGALGSVTLAPALTAGIDLITAAINRATESFLGFAQGAFTALQAVANPLQFLAQQAINLALGFAPIKSAVEAAGQAIVSFVSSFAGISWDAISGAGAAAWNAVSQAVASAGEAIGNFVSSLTGITWDTISSGATAAWNAVTTAIQGAGTAISNFVSSLGSITWDAISSAGVAAWNAITDAIQSAIDALLKFIGLKPQAGGAPGTSGGGKARGGLIGGRGTGTSDSNLAWLSRGEYVVRAAAVRQFGAAFFAALNAGRIPRFQDGGIDFGRAGTPQGAPIGSRGGGGLSGAISGWIDKLSAANNAAIHATDAHIQELSQVMAAIDADKWKLSDALFGVMVEMTNAVNKLSAAGLARGGLIGGRGSGTSDSNLAWLSRGEFVITAAAVRRFGAGFFAALNAGMIPGFALGGLVPRPAMAFAGGGSVGSAAHKNLGTLTLVTQHGIATGLVDARIAEALTRVAVRGQVTSGGRKPSRYT